MINKEEREKILDEYYNSDLSRKEICEKYNLNFETFKAWIKRYNRENPKVKKIPKKFESLIEKLDFKNMSSEELKIELLKTRIELERLKKNYSVATDTLGRKVFVSYSKKTTK